MSKKDLNSKDIIDIYDWAWRQCKEDREEILEQYKHLRDHVKASPDMRYPINGDTLAKFAELLTKQTAQILEMLKIANKDKQGDDSLSADDFKFIQDQINKPQ